MSVSSIKRALTKSASLLGWWNAGYKGRLPQHAKRVGAATIAAKLLASASKRAR